MVAQKDMDSNTDPVQKSDPDQNVIRREPSSEKTKTKPVSTPDPKSGLSVTPTGLALRPYLGLFAEAMECQLRLNDHKSGIEDMRVDDAVERLWDEVRELDRAAYRDPTGAISTIFTKPKTLVDVANEALDVANFAMAVWLGARRDHAERLEEIKEAKADAR